MAEQNRLAEPLSAISGGGATVVSELEPGSEPLVPPAFPPPGASGGPQAIVQMDRHTAVPAFVIFFTMSPLHVPPPHRAGQRAALV